MRRLSDYLGLFDNNHRAFISERQERERRPCEDGAEGKKAM